MKPIKDTRAPLEKDTCVGEYVIEALLARGGSALTYFAHKKANGAKCVIKEGYPVDIGEEFQRIGLILTCRNADLDAQKREQISLLFKAENEKANEYRSFKNNNSERIFEHQDITKEVVNTSEFNGTVCSYICIDTSYGKTLYDIVGEGALTLKSKFTNLREAAISLELIHRKGEIHGDLTPKNLFFPLEFDQPYAKLLDFGSAIKLTDLNENVWISKSDKFSAPEIVARYEEMRNFDGYSSKKSPFLQRIGYSSDVYSLGMIMIFVLMGKESFYDGTRLEALIDDIEYGNENAFEPYLDDAFKVLSPMITRFLKRCLYYDAAKYDKSIRPTLKDFTDEVNLWSEIVEKKTFDPAVLAIGSLKNKPKELEKINILQEWLAEVKR